MIRSSLAPDQQGRHGHPVQPLGQLGIVGTVPQQARDRGHLPVAADDEVDIRLRRQVRLDHLEIVHQQRRQFLARHAEQVGRRCLRHPQAGRRDQHQLLDPVRMLGGELRGHPAAQREADQVEPLQSQRVEQVQVMHDIVLHLVDRLVVAGLRKARMERDDDPEMLHPGLGELPAVEGAAPVQEDQGLALAAAQDHRLHAVDGVFVTREFCHRAFSSS